MRDELAAGTGAVGGPGLRVTVEDAPVTRADPEAADPDLRVQDVDLQVVVNGLWAAGAEAVAVNGQRLTALTAIRTAGSAILVDLAPLSSPYVVEAVGRPHRDADGVRPDQRRPAPRDAAQHLRDPEPGRPPAEDLRLPGSSRTRLQSATAIAGDGAAPRALSAPDPGTGARRSAGDVASSAPADESGEGTP